MGKAAYGMRQWNTSIECFSRCLALNDSNQQAKLELERSKERLHESLTGEISLTKLHDNFESKKDIRMDVADYVNHDKIEVKDLGAKGKGVVAKEFIKKGTKLVVSKAFSFGYEDPSVNRSRVLLSLNLVKKTMDVQSQVHNLLDLVFKVKSNPFLAREFYALHGGAAFDRNEKLGDGIVDIARLEATCCLNSFSAENVFKEMMSSENSSSEISKLMSKSTRIWLFPSYFHHSCISNTTRVYFGDVVIISAFKDIQQGEEVTLLYESPGKARSLRPWNTFLDFLLKKVFRSNSDHVQQAPGEVQSLQLQVRVPTLPNRQQGPGR